MKDMKKSYFFVNPREMRSQGRAPQSVEVMKSLTTGLFMPSLQITGFHLSANLAGFPKK